MVTFGALQEFHSQEEVIAAYVKRVQVFFKANGMEEARQVPVLLNVSEERCTSLLYDLLVPDSPDSNPTDGDSHGTFQPNLLIFAERFYFFLRNQKTTETIRLYVAELHQLATHCEVRDTLETASCVESQTGPRNTTS